MKGRVMASRAPRGFKDLSGQKVECKVTEKDGVHRKMGVVNTHYFNGDIIVDPLRGNKEINVRKGDYKVMA